MWNRESAESPRLSPITQIRPTGTLTSKVIVEGAAPGNRYAVSLSGVPLTVTRPCASQHLTSSPAMPMTRLIRSCSLLEGSRPTKVKTFLTSRTTALSLTGVVVPSSQPPGSWKTTIWPRCGVEPNHGENLFTSTRSPGMIVFSIDCEGMKNAWTMKVLMPRASSSAIPSRIGISRHNRIGLSRRRRPLTTPILQSPRTAPRAGVANVADYRFRLKKGEHPRFPRVPRVTREK